MTLSKEMPAPVLPGAIGGKIEKLVEYCLAHCSAHSEAASYYTNHPARVQFWFSKFA